ncbi:MAG: hypothetical protein ABJD97_05515, partial [Betaproteobacteria bacterium]
ASASDADKRRGSGSSSSQFAGLRADNPAAEPACSTGFSCCGAELGRLMGVGQGLRSLDRS